jgi:uncharacterized membrane protein
MIVYFRPKRFETYKHKTIYEYLGIKWFKKYLITDGDLVRKWRNIKQDFNKNDSIIQLTKAERETRKYEIIHLIFLLITILILTFNFKKLSFLQWVLVHLINLYANVYPLFLQRHNRIRILKALKNTETRKSNHNGPT